MFQISSATLWREPRGSAQRKATNRKRKSIFSFSFSFGFQLPSVYPLNLPKPFPCRSSLCQHPCRVMTPNQKINDQQHNGHSPLANSTLRAHFRRPIKKYISSGSLCLSSFSGSWYVEPLSSILNQSLRSRKDQISDGKIREKILKNSPKKNEEFFVVPKVVE